MTALLNKLLVARFYKVNAGFFLLFLLLFFGIMNAHDSVLFHYAMMRAMTGSVLYACIGIVVFSLYNLKCTSFCLRQMSLPENSFLYNARALSAGRQIRAFILNHGAIYFPALAYGVITCVAGFAQGYTILPMVILLWQFFMCAIGAYACIHRLNGIGKRSAMTLPSVVTFKKKTFPFYLIHYSLDNRKSAFLAIKIFSLLLLQFMVCLNNEEASRENVCFLILFLISAHALLPAYYVQFMENELSFLRNLPITTTHKFLIYMLTYAVIFVPELLFLLWNERGVLSLMTILSLYALSISQMALYTGLQYLKNIKTATYMGIVYGLFFTDMLLLASLDIWTLVIADAVVATVLFMGLYHRYEAGGRKIEE